MNKKKIAVLIAAVIAIAAAITAIILFKGDSEKYKVKLNESAEKLTVTISGNTDGLLWAVDNSSENVVSVQEVSNGKKAVFEVTPKGESVSFFDLVFTLGSNDYFVFVKGMTDENGDMTEITDGYYDPLKITASLDELSQVSACVYDSESIEVSFPKETEDGVNWEYKADESLTFALSYYGENGAKYLISAVENGKYTAVFYNSVIGKQVEVKFNIEENGLYNTDKISVSDYTPE